MKALPIVCPAASPVQPANDEPSVICGVLELANDGAQIAGRRRGAEVSALMSGTRMAATVELFCAGRGIPGSPMSYCACAIWRAEKARIAAGRSTGPDGLRDEQAGVSARRRSVARAGA